MRKVFLLQIFLFFLLFCSCFLKKPEHIEVDYYDDGHVKQVRKYYEDGMNVKYYAMERKRKKPYGLFYRKLYPKK